MTRTRLPFLLALTFVLLAGFAAGADASDCPQALFAEESVSMTETTAPSPFFLASETKTETSRSNMSPSSKGDNLAMACEWYDISCSNGTTDECCGSQSSCGVYCEEVCGEPCVYRPE